MVFMILKENGIITEFIHYTKNNHLTHSIWKDMERNLKLSAENAFFTVYVNGFAYKAYITKNQLVFERSVFDTIEYNQYK